MQKIPTLFQRTGYDGHKRVRDEVTPGCEWVLAGEGRATRKFDGTCCMVRAGELYRRHELRFRRGPSGTLDRVGGVPRDFEPACDVDQVTLKQQGWVPVGDGPEDRWHREAFEFRNGECLAWEKRPLIDGTYELVGPKVQGNPDGFPRHDLVRHGEWIIGDGFAADPQKWDDCPRTFEGIRQYLRTHPFEGVVWHHPDGRMVKIKARDFGIGR